jgi:hypothetical protein
LKNKKTLKTESAKVSEATLRELADHSQSEVKTSQIQAILQKNRPISCTVEKLPNFLPSK